MNPSGPAVKKSKLDEDSKTSSATSRPTDQPSSQQPSSQQADVISAATSSIGKVEFNALVG